MKWIICYGVCPLVGGWIIWWKQGKFLTREQPLAFFVFGPLTLFFAMLPTKFWSRQDKSR